MRCQFVDTLMFSFLMMPAALHSLSWLKGSPLVACFRWRRSGWQAFWGTGALLASSLYCYVLGIVLQWEWASNMGQL